MKITIKGLDVLFDDEDAYIANYKWHFNSQAYPTTKAVVHGKKKTAQMHRMILGYPDGVVDHINRNPLDNRRANLRVVNRNINARNQGWRKSRGLPKGVYKKRKNFEAHFEVEGKTIYIGIYKTPSEAAEAYDFFAYFFFGDTAVTNEMLEAEGSIIEKSREPSRLELIQKWDEEHDVRRKAA